MGSIAMSNAISGLTNFQRVLDTVGSNIANISTPGYKKSRFNFREAYSQTLRSASAPSSSIGGTNPVQIGLGTDMGSIDTQYTQGVLETTGRGTDLAITGNGFFIVNNGSKNLYTRNGSFSIDESGNLVDSSGNKVQGWNADATGQVNTATAVTGINIPLGQEAIANATSSASFVGNLDASQAVYNAGPPPTGGQFTFENIIYDSLGNSHTLSITLTKVTPTIGGADSQWDWTTLVDGVAPAAPAGTGSAVYDTDGKYNTTLSTANNVQYTVGGGAADLNTSLDFSSTTQLSSSGQYSVTMQNQNGYAAGTLNDFNIDINGNIIGKFSNGLAKTLGQLALASFSNAQGLEKTDGGLLDKTLNSGAPLIGTANTESRGGIKSETLELSNVDLSSEFTNMIIAQRAFQANSRVITTMDQVLEEVANLKR